MEILDNKAVLIRTRNPGKYTVIPKSRIVEEHDNGGYTVAVYWGLDEMRVLRNLGVRSAPSPITRKYNWPGRYIPMAHQIETAAFLTLHRRAFCFNEPGTGKTLSALWAADYLMHRGDVRRVLILCPLSIMHSAWMGDINNSVMHRSAVVAHHSSAMRRVELVQGDYELVIANYEGLNLIANEVRADGRFDLVIIDEANAYKNPSTQRWKSLASIIEPHTYLWMMTGTPASQSPVDAYGLAKMVNPAGVPKFATAWRDRVMNKITQFKWAPKPEAKRLVHEALQPAIRFTKEQCLDLPPVVTVTREVPLSPQQTKYYKLLKEQMLFQTAGETISAVNAGVAVSKLLQISCIAYNTPVLTQLGWMPICNVTPDDLVWDGEAWVKSEGAVFKGMRKTMCLDGVALTADHLVLTDNGWKTAEDCIDGYASKRFDRATVRLPDGIGAFWDIKWEDQESNVALPVRLRGRSGTGIPELALYSSPQCKTLRVSSRKVEHNARIDFESSVRNLGGHAAQMPEQIRQGLQELWRTGYHSVQALGRLVRGFLGRHEGGLRGYIDARPQKREQGIQQGELPMGYSARAEQQHAFQSVVGNAEGLYDCSAGRTGLRIREKHLAGATDTLRMAATRSANAEGSTAVFDLVNCGPRNRFVVRGDDGELLIVHNCGAAYTDDKETVEFDASPRLKVLMEAIEETDRKVIIFAMFRSSIDTITSHLTKQGVPNAQIHGDVNATRRGQIINDFQNTDNIRVLVMQPQATAHGITLTAANTVVFYGPLMSVEMYLQCIARADRKGQNADKVTVIHIQSSPIEVRMFKAMASKVTDHALLVGMFDSEIKNN